MTPLMVFLEVTEGVALSVDQAEEVVKFLIAKISTTACSAILGRHSPFRSDVRASRSRPR